MAYTPLSPRTVGAIITDTIWNTEIVDNQKAQAPDIFVAAGDMSYATGANAMTRLGIGTTGQALTVVSGLPAWRDVVSDLPYYGFWS